MPTSLGTPNAASPQEAGDGAARSAPKQLRVCHLAYAYYENDNRIIRYAEALAERGDDVDVIALRRRGQRCLDRSVGVRVFRIQRRSMTERTAWSYLPKLLWFVLQATVVVAFRHLRKRYDIVHVHNVPDFLVFAALVPKLTGARVILDIHDIVPELYAGKFGDARLPSLIRCLLRVERLACWFADHVIVSNHLWADKLVRRSVPAWKCTTVLNYPDLRKFRPKHRRPDGRFIALYPGTLNHHQGLDIAVKAFARVKDRMPTAEFHIYGEGPARSQLAQLAREYGVSDRVVLKDRVPFDQISDIIASADLGVVPKRDDGFGGEAFSTKTLEFMACGVPVVVARTRVDAYYFDDSIVRFFTPGDEEDLAAALLEMYQHRSNCGAQVSAARAFAIRNSWQERVADYQQLIEELVTWGRGRRNGA